MHGLDAALELAAPRQCSGCDLAGVRWCVRCAHTVGRLAELPGVGWVDRPDVDLPATWSHADYIGPVRGAIPAYKDGRRDLGPVLQSLLRAGLAGLLTADPGLRASLADRSLLIVVAPSRAASLRTRGCLPVRDLVRAAWSPAAAGSLPLAPHRCLRFHRRAADQGGLSRRERGTNLVGAFRAAGVRGRSCLLVDDVVTTGATLAEGARALRAAGASDVTALAIAATRLRGPDEAAAPNLRGPIVYSPVTPG